MNKKVSAIVVLAFTLGGCATVPLESIEKPNELKQFNPPSEGKAGLYIYRDSFVG